MEAGEDHGEGLSKWGRDEGVEEMDGTGGGELICSTRSLSSLAFNADVASLLMRGGGLGGLMSGFCFPFSYFIVLFPRLLFPHVCGEVLKSGKGVGLRACRQALCRTAKRPFTWLACWR